MSKDLEYKSKIAIHPGRALAAQLDFLGVSQKWLADRTGLSEKHISEILNEKASITADTAVKLSNALGGSVEFWVNLDSNYRTALAKDAQEKLARKEAAILKKIPYDDMANLGWVPKTKDEVERVLNLYRFYGVSSLKNIPSAQSVAFKKSGNSSNEYAVAAWLRNGEILASKAGDISDYDAKSLKRALIEIREIIHDSPNNISQLLVYILSQCGVILVFSESLPKMHISGAVRWVGQHPLIELNTAYKTTWFTLLHEIGHILLHGKKAQFIELDNLEADVLEEEADSFASDILGSVNW